MTSKGRTHVQVSVTMPQVLLDQINLARGDVARSRFIWRTLQKTLDVKSESKNSDGSGLQPQPAKVVQG